MSDVMTRIELGGVLGKTFGKTHYRSISTTQEACKALSATINGFEKFMNTSKQRGLSYAVFRGKKNIGIDELGFPVKGEVIRIVPVPIGSKKAGVLQTILGAVLVAVGGIEFHTICRSITIFLSSWWRFDPWWCCPNAITSANRISQ